jgi:oligopeptide/dipeptide ABC transporter ATP-binding protein
MSAAPVLELRDLSVDVPVARGVLHAVRGISLQVHAGDALGLVGESGGGKSLTLRAAMGLLPAPAQIVGGHILIDGEDVTALSERERRRRVTQVAGMIFQDSMTALNPVMRVGPQIAEVPQRRLGMSRNAAKLRALELMTSVGIPDADRRYRAYPHELSGGLRQRVAIAIALSGEPRAVLCDEPTTALDVTIQAQVLALLRSLRSDRDLAVVLVTHDLAVVNETCTEVAVMYAGRIVERGPVSSVLTQPDHPYSFSLLRSVPDPEVVVSRLLAIPGAPPDLVEPVTGCAFAARCPFHADACDHGEPPLLSVALKRESACLFAGDAEYWSERVRPMYGRSSAVVGDD